MTRLTETKSVGLATDTASAVEVVVPFVDLTSATESVRHEVAAGFDGVLARNAFVNGPRWRTSSASSPSGAELRTASGSRVAWMRSGSRSWRRMSAGRRGRRPCDHVHRDVRGGDAGRRGSSRRGCAAERLQHRLHRGRGRLSERTAWLLPVHLYGQMADMRALRDRGERQGVPMLEDACQAHGAERDGLSAGSAARWQHSASIPRRTSARWGTRRSRDRRRAACGASAHAPRARPDATYRSRCRGLHGPARHPPGAGAFVQVAARSPVGMATSGRRSGLLGSTRGHRRPPFPPVHPGSEPVWHLYVVRTEDPVRLSTTCATAGLRPEGTILSRRTSPRIRRAWI